MQDFLYVNVEHQDMQLSQYLKKWFWLQKFGHLKKTLYVLLNFGTLQIKLQVWLLN